MGLISERITAKQAWFGSIIFALVFTGVIWFFGPNLQRFVEILLPDQGASWYYWKLPVRDGWRMNIVWELYLAHQLAVWGAIYWAQKNLRGKPYTENLNKYNIVTLGVNAVFMVLHMVQTQLWFDGLAQDVPIWTSQGSVIIMLVVVLIIENQRRGLFRGRKAGKPFTAEVTAFFRRNHTYVFAWALVYTFWFHPMAVDPQLLSGFLYMFLLFTQVSLAYTTTHLNPKWIILLESYVAFHALIVAVYNTAFFGSADIWPMFFVGFTFMSIFTQMYALKLSKTAYTFITGLYVAFVAWLYLPFGLGRSIEFLLRMEILWIPIILYGLAAAFTAVAYIYYRLRMGSLSQVLSKE